MAQLTFLWIMIVFALTWDMLGGQMGYNSFGNIVFFGIGMYVARRADRRSITTSAPTPPPPAPMTLELHAATSS